MTLVLELNPETEAFIAAEAQARGTSPEQAAAAALTELAVTRRQATVASKLKGLESLIALAQTMPRHREVDGLGPLPDNAVALDYEERENALR